MTTGGTFTAIGVRPFAAGVKTATEGSDLRPLWLSVTAAPILPWHSPKNKQGIPATPNMPKLLVFSGFPNILFMPFVSNKRFTFPHTRLRLKIPAHLRNPLVSVSAWKCLRSPLPARHHGLNAYITLYCIAAVSLVLTSCPLETACHNTLLA